MPMQLIGGDPKNTWKTMQKYPVLLPICQLIVCSYVCSIFSKLHKAFLLSVVHFIFPSTECVVTTNLQNLKLFSPVQLI